jgi:hypothetical protein
MVSLHFCWGRAMRPARQFPFRTPGPMHSLKVSLMACAPAVGAAQSGRVQRSALLRVSAGRISARGIHPWPQAAKRRATWLTALSARRCSIPANLRAFLHQAVPALAGGFDCERGRLPEREFPLDDWRRREADLPFEAPYRLGDEELWALVYLLIEHQSGEDPVMPLRLYFVVLYWERPWRA